MKTPDEKFVIVFNGEIYNYRSLRKELEDQGASFHSTSDTEVLLHLYRRDKEKMLDRLRGMFAFAIWDADNRRLFFARDRIGKKPFYYQADANGFAFASELKALLVHARPQIDWSAVRSFIGLQYVPSPQTGFVGLSSLPPGHCGTFEQGNLRITRYHVTERHPKFTGSFDDAARSVRALLDESVRLRMIADVPVGAFLSGGMDSSAVAALMARASSSPIQTFTMGFPSFGFDEREEARAFAKHLGADHHEFEARPQDAIAIADDVIRLYDAPYADSSAIPTWLLARETRPFVKAAMAGDGGDELFGGYRRYQAYLRAELIRAWHLGRPASHLFKDPRYLRFARLLDSLRVSPAEAYATLFTGSYFTREDELNLLTCDFRLATDGSSAHRFIANRFQSSLNAEGMLDFDLTSYLPDDLNIKMDRASMAHGLESRCPLLDQELVAFAIRLPQSFLLRRGQQKPLLRKAVEGLVPEHVFRRPKRGFQVPLHRWFQKELRTPFVERCLSAESKLNRVCEPQAVKRLLEENDRGFDHGNRLWMLFALATWLEKNSP